MACVSVVILAMTQFLHMFFARIRQPRVIAEVIGGVLLGPTVLGRIPNFTNSIFPALSLPMLNLTATIGLVLFLFLVGLELDVRLVKRNMKASMAISACGLVLPLGLGAALGVPLYHEFVDPSVNFGYFLLFTAVAIGITAFPVLCRILTELKLLEDTVGVVVLAAGVGNDVSAIVSPYVVTAAELHLGCRMDPAGADCRPRQCIQWSHGTLGASDRGRICHLLTVPCAVGVPMGSAPDWEFG